MRIAKSAIVATVIVLGFHLAACDRQETPEPVERIRSIKTITVTERASGQERKFPGLVEPVDRASLSFEVGGAVRKLHKKVGDKISEGQVIAVLDDKKYRLNVDAAHAEVKKAEAQVQGARRNYERNRKIQKIDSGAISQRSVDQAEATYESAQQTVGYARSQLNLARQNLTNTKLVAPFDGVIAERHVNAHQEVSRGQPIYDMFAEGAIEVAIDVPETVIDSLYLGLPTEIRFSKGPSHIYRGTISEIGSVGGTASTFPVKVAVQEVSEKFQPGMSAEVSLVLTTAGQESGYLIPVTAIAPGDKDALGYVFVFDRKTSTVRRTPVEFPERALRDNFVVVIGGVKPEDVIAVAGVSFLENGQKVKLIRQ